ncbi:uncharacterized protein LOC111385860 [Olea europaea var. sylvestris]|uniref:uncharacterized protein LOC111385860 n=1 Tax=Olea europaea var. sylvestris TaxID=158386 RepID=UPI000C1D3A60|nr:uncharacterized protein LOC111385860 [Olea europaea var. sylvestris]
MEVYDFFSFLLILKESIKLLPKNGKLMASIFIFSLILYAILFISFTFSFQFLFNDIAEVYMNSSFVADQSPFTPNTTSLRSNSTELLGIERLRDDFALLVAVQMACLLAVLIVSNFSTTATILVSAMSYKDETLSLKDLCLRIVRTWKRALITEFYTKLHAMAYVFLCVALSVPLLMSANLTTISATVLLVISACVCCLYLPVVWNLAIVVCVVDKGCGIEALGKAAALIKGKRLHGFMLNLCFNPLCLILFLNCGMMPENWTINGLIVMGVFFLGIFFPKVAYTVLYFRCKKSYGEEIELYRSMEYSKLPSTQPVSKSSNLPSRVEEKFL